MYLIPNILYCIFILCKVCTSVYIIIGSRRIDIEIELREQYYTVQIINFKLNLNLQRIVVK